MSTNNWWATKLGTGMPPTPPRQEVPMPPTQQPMARFTPMQPPTPTSKAQSAQQVETCPDCGSNNYMSVQNTAKRCYNCGYPLQQSGSKYGSLTGAKVEGTAKQSLGNDSTSNWNPQGIIGTIQ